MQSISLQPSPGRRGLIPWKALRGLLLAAFLFRFNCLLKLNCAAIARCTLNAAHCRDLMMQEFADFSGINQWSGIRGGSFLLSHLIAPKSTLTLGRVFADNLLAAYEDNKLQKSFEENPHSYYLLLYLFLANTFLHSARTKAAQMGLH